MLLLSPPQVFDCLDESNTCCPSIQLSSSCWLLHSVMIYEPAQKATTCGAVSRNPHFQEVLNTCDRWGEALGWCFKTLSSRKISLKPFLFRCFAFLILYRFTINMRSLILPLLTSALKELEINLERVASGQTLSGSSSQGLQFFNPYCEEHRTVPIIPIQPPVLQFGNPYISNATRGE